MRRALDDTDAGGWGRSVVLGLLLVAACLSPAATAFAAPIAPKHVRGHIVGGVPAGASVPYQVALVDAGRTAPFSVFCGGTLRDATHVVTAAHCVADADADDLAVVAGMVDRDTGGELVGVSAISSHPAYSDATGSADVAVLTLAAPVTTGTAIPVTAATTDWTGAPATISGWGLSSEGGDSPLALQRAPVRVLDDAACGNYGGEFAPGTMLCAGGTTGPGGATIDTCQGDSGGPLAADAPGTPLVGVVSFGRDCGDPRFPGVYARLADPGLHAFVTTLAPVARPALTTRPAVAGTTAVGRTLICDPGGWTGDPLLSVTWLSAIVRADGGVAGVRVDGRGASLPVGATLAGRIVTCEVTAANAGGARSVQARPVGPVDGATTPAAGAPVAAPPGDLVAPTVRITRRRCAKRRCTLTFRASDSGGPAIRATVSYRRLTGCRKGRAGRRCRATRKIRGKTAGRGLFTARTPRLAAARYRFTVVATDAAGNGSRPRVATLRVPRR